MRPEVGGDLILVTGAAGKTGRAVLRALARRGLPTRALVHRDEQMEGVRLLGAEQVAVGDLCSGADLERAFEGVHSVYHICPNVHPEEVSIGEAAIRAALEASVQHFVFHSVHLPRVEVMPHHWLKHRVEERLRHSGLRHTILQPCAYMQNVLAEIGSVTERGVFRVPYSVDSQFSLVDLEDVAEAAATVLAAPASAPADSVYELCGPAAVSPIDIATAFGKALGGDVRAEAEDVGDWERRAREAGMGEYQLDALVRMFRYYDVYGFVGDPRPLQNLLGRAPTSLESFVEAAQRARTVTRLLDGF